MRNAAVLLFVSGALALPVQAHADDCPHQARREERLDAAGVRTVRVVAGAGSLRIDGQAGAGAIAIHGIACADREATLDDMVIEEDGSGGIEISGVRGNVTVRDDGSGSISVRDVAGDFTVDEDGSGGITHAAVRGRVKIPSRD